MDENFVIHAMLIRKILKSHFLAPSLRWAQKIWKSTKYSLWNLESLHKACTGCFITSFLLLVKLKDYMCYTLNFCFHTPFLHTLYICAWFQAMYFINLLFIEYKSTVSFLFNNFRVFRNFWWRAKNIFNTKSKSISCERKILINLN